MSIVKTILKSIKFILVGIVIVSVIGFANMRQSDRYVKHVKVNIDNQFQNYFIDDNDVYELIDELGKDYLLGSDLGSLDLSDIESKVKRHRFVEDAEIYHDLHGNLTIEVKQNRPIARLLNSSDEDQYIGTTGLLLPESNHFTARVLLVTKSEEILFSEENIADDIEGERIFEVLKFISEDRFWKAQIAGIHIDENLELTLQPQVTKQLIEFGKAEDIENKFKKLKIFYKKILPYKGWNSYETVNLKYRNQIVCK